MKKKLEMKFFFADDWIIALFVSDLILELDFHRHMLRSSLCSMIWGYSLVVAFIDIWVVFVDYHCCGNLVTNSVISHELGNDRKMLSTGGRVEDTKGVIRIRISKKNRQHNGQKDKKWSTRYTHKTKDRVTRTQLKTGGELRCLRKGKRSCYTSDTRRVNLVTNPTPVVLI
jgi:hypothetical protein